MQINDEAIVLKKKKYSESSLLVTFLTLNHGINTGLVKGVLKKDFGTYEVGNKVFIKCNCRLEEHLWNCRFELIKNYSINFFDENIKLNTLLTVCSLIDLCFPKKLPLLKVYQQTIKTIDNLVSENWLKIYILWELFILSEVGYGLDLSKCCVSGVNKDLLYVSPNSGKAVCEKVGKKYKKKLLNLPDFLLNKTIQPNNNSLMFGLDLTGFFLDKYLKKNHNKILPFYRRKIYQKQI